MATGRMELGPTGKTVAANVKRLRDAQGLSLRALSERMTERKLSPDALNKIENGRLQGEPESEGKRLHVRRVDVDDLAALAAALRVSPSALLLPLVDDTGATVEITGVGQVSADRAWDWVDGELPIERIDPGDPGGALLRFNLYSRPPGRRMQLSPGGGEADG